MGIFSIFKKQDALNVVINAPEVDNTEYVQREKHNVHYSAEHKVITSKRPVMTRGVPADYFFGGNDKIKCKEMSILDPLPIDVHKAYFNGISGRNEWEGSKCFAIAESVDYIFYNYGCYPDGSGGCNLRQNKDNPKKVVFFGKSRMMSCIFHDHLVQVDSSAYGTELYLWTRDVHTGKERIYPWFGKHSIPVERSSSYNQDSILGMSIDEEIDALKIEVRRQFCEFADPADPENICNADTNYNLIVKYQNGEFVATAEFPELNVSQIFEK